MISNLLLQLSVFHSRSVKRPSDTHTHTLRSEALDVACGLTVYECAVRARFITRQQNQTLLFSSCLIYVHVIDRASSFCSQTAPD